MELTRRTMLKMAGGSALSLGFPGKILAVLQDGTLVVQDHRVPADKNLTADWKASLITRGQKEVWSGEALDSIGMPVGGIASGQLYVCGDGTLGCWELFNHHDYQNQGPYSYANRPIPKLVKFGFTVAVNGNVWHLNKSGFKDIAFNGVYPCAKIKYRDAACPVSAQMTAYSPFIPLNALDSGLPATIFELSFVNQSDKPVEIEITGFLENACSRSAQSHPGRRMRHTTATSNPDFTCMAHSADESRQEYQERTNPRSELLLADFEGNNYGAWVTEGAAFGPGPAKGTLPDQQQVTGYVGKNLVNSYYKGDASTGRLTSPEFTVERDFINFKIGGGDIPNKVCVNLLVDSKVVRTATGQNDERLLWESWNVVDLAGRKAKIEIVDNATGAWGHVNVDQIAQSDRVASQKDIATRHGSANLDTGSMALAMLAEGHADSNNNYEFSTPYIGEVKPKPVRIAAHGSHKVTYVLAWHFPNHPNGRNYSNHFSNAEAVAKYVADHHVRLKRDTELWVDTFYASSLPYWLLDRLHSTAGNLSTGVTEWWKSGHFWCWEGVVCCSGTCTHVWNYEHTLARLFPELERNIRVETDFGTGFDAATGLVGMRSDREYAADGQCGTILKAYREHQISPDYKYLKSNWPKIKKALEFLITHDGNGDGLIEDAQPNTYDIDFFGANTFVGSLYLGALRAGEEMAKELGDHEFASKCRTIFTNGSEATMKRLWNGEYFIQEVDESKYKQYQYGPGCLADQLFGQGWAHQVGLGHLYPADKVVKGLQSVWKYNWAPDVAGQNKRWPPQRPFALPGEGGLFTCTWPIGGREKDPVLYRDEIWTGIEYQVAGHMIWEGLVEEGLSICKAIHERYHPLKRNPYNEVECSDHYARAMASWGVLTALCGFTYHGPEKKIGFAPKITPEAFSSVFTAAEGWGTFAQSIVPGLQSNHLAVKWGKLPLREIALESDYEGAVKVWIGKREIPSHSTRVGRRLVVRFPYEITLKPSEHLKVEIAKA